eukprot:CFRG4268T1
MANSILSYIRGETGEKPLTRYGSSQANIFTPLLSSEYDQTNGHSPYDDGEDHSDSHIDNDNPNLFELGADSWGMQPGPDSLRGFTRDTPEQLLNIDIGNVHLQVADLDELFSNLYDYFLRKGFWPTVLSRLLNLVQAHFVVAVTIILMVCVDYETLFRSYDFEKSINLSGIYSLHPLFSMVLLLYLAIWSYLFIRLVKDLPSLVAVGQFYHEVLGLGEDIMETIAWPEITHRLIGAQRQARFCPAQADITDLDIANHIMREENFLIALFNKDVIPLHLNLPFIGKIPYFPKSLEWSIRKCLMGYVFDRKHRVHPHFRLKGKAHELSHGLTRRFRLMAVLNLILAPFVIPIVSMYFFFRYAEEFRRNPGSMSLRHWSPYMRWKCREFNELSHVYARRLNMACEPAEAYVNAFTSATTSVLARFVAFISGACVAILMVLTVIDEDFLNVHLTPDRSVLWYIGVFGAVLAVSRGFVPESDTDIDPQPQMLRVVNFTHYLPQEWKDAGFESVLVRKEFSRLYEFKALFLIQETLSVAITPFILWYTIPSYSRAIVDLFRETVVHKASVGDVCSFAMFDFKYHRDILQPYMGEKLPVNVRGNLKSPNNMLNSSIDTNNGGISAHVDVNVGAREGVGGRESGRGREDGVQSGDVRVNVDTGESVQDNAQLGTDDGKMEKSFINFVANNPGFIPEPEGKHFLSTLNQLQCNPQHNHLGFLHPHAHPRIHSRSQSPYPQSYMHATRNTGLDRSGLSEYDNNEDVGYGLRNSGQRYDTYAKRNDNVADQHMFSGHAGPTVGAGVDGDQARMAMHRGANESIRSYYGESPSWAAHLNMGFQTAGSVSPSASLSASEFGFGLDRSMKRFGRKEAIQEADDFTSTGVMLIEDLLSASITQDYRPNGHTPTPSVSPPFVSHRATHERIPMPTESMYAQNNSNLYKGALNPSMGWERTHHDNTIVSTGGYSVWHAMETDHPTEAILNRNKYTETGPSTTVASHESAPQHSYPHSLPSSTGISSHVPQNDMNKKPLGMNEHGSTVGLNEGSLKPAAVNLSFGANSTSSDDDDSDTPPTLVQKGRTSAPPKRSENINETENEDNYGTAHSHSARTESGDHYDVLPSLSQMTPARRSCTPNEHIPTTDSECREQINANESVPCPSNECFDSSIKDYTVRQRRAGSQHEIYESGNELSSGSEAPRTAILGTGHGTPPNISQENCTPSSYDDCASSHGPDSPLISSTELTRTARRVAVGCNIPKDAPANLSENMSTPSTRESRHSVRSSELDIRGYPYLKSSTADYHQSQAQHQYSQHTHYTQEHTINAPENGDVDVDDDVLRTQRETHGFTSASACIADTTHVSNPIGSTNFPQRVEHTYQNAQTKNTSSALRNHASATEAVGTVVDVDELDLEDGDIQPNLTEMDNTFHNSKGSVRHTSPPLSAHDHIPTTSQLSTCTPSAMSPNPPLKHTSNVSDRKFQSSDAVADRDTSPINRVVKSPDVERSKDNTGSRSSPNLMGIHRGHP